jgi:hypothetical protein
VAAELGIRFVIVPQHRLEDGINAVRSIFSRLYFDREKCRLGLNALTNYRKEFDERNREYRIKPVHDWTSHGADAMRYLAMGMDMYVRNAATRPPDVETQFNPLER